MFCGIVTGTGRILNITKMRRGARLTVGVPFSLSTTPTGDSVAVNGCCLTVASKKKNSFEADLSNETLRVTNLGRLKAGDFVNLERPLRMKDRIGGHLVQGHVDGVGEIVAIRHVGANPRVRPKTGQTHRSAPTISREITIQFPKRLRRYIIPKGSIAVDGISMTVNRLTPKSFALVVIPHTLRKTNLAARRAGDAVNLEVDLVGKYIESLKRKARG